MLLVVYLLHYSSRFRLNSDWLRHDKTFLITRQAVTCTYFRSPRVRLAFGSLGWRLALSFSLSLFKGAGRLEGPRQRLRSLFPFSRFCVVSSLFLSLRDLFATVSSRYLRPEVVFYFCDPTRRARVNAALTPSSFSSSSVFSVRYKSVTRDSREGSDSLSIPVDHPTYLVTAISPAERWTVVAKRSADSITHWVIVKRPILPYLLPAEVSSQ